MDIGKRIKELRKSKGLTQIEFAEKAGIAVNSLRLYESGKRQPRLYQLGKIAKCFGMSVFELAEGDWRSVDMGGIVDFDDSLKKQLDIAFSRLNNKGKSVALGQVLELTEMPEYQLNEE